MAEATTGGMVGGGFYDAHSAFQAEVAQSAAPLLQKAVAAIDLPAGMSRATIADYGCAEGKNSIVTLGAAMRLLQARGVAQFTALHSDVPGNDWVNLVANLSAPGSYLKEFPQARTLLAPRSFFERVTEPASVTLGTSGSAAHWLSRQPPGLDMPDSLYRSDAPPTELTKILAQAATDWETFLAARAEELQPGGVLFVQMLGAEDSGEQVRVSAAGLVKLMNECALELVAAGRIGAENYARYCFPVVPRTVAEASAPVLGPLADRLELLHAGLHAVPSPYRQQLDKDGDVAAFAQHYTAFTRAFSESSLRAALFDAGDADALAEDFYAAMRERLEKRPDDYPFDDLTLSVIVRRRG